MEGKAERTYALIIKGEQHTFGPFGDWAELTFPELCAVLSDLTGYKASFLAADLPERFDRLGYAQVKPASLHGDEVPQFMIRSVDGGKPEA